MLDEQQRTQQSLKIIREYLTKEFPGFKLTEDTSDARICHRFSVTDLKTYQQFKLKVGWPRLSDKSNTPDTLLRSLVHGDVAHKMRRLKGDYLYW